MSIGFVLLATRQQLWEHLTYDEASLDIMPDGRPKPLCGSKFVSLFGSTINAIDPAPEDGFTTELSFTLTMTIRTSPLPAHAKKYSYIESQISLEKELWRIIDKLYDERIDIYTFAQEMVNDDPYMAGTYTGMLKMTSVDGSPSIAYPEWFYADDDDYRKNQAERSAGLYMSATFGGLRYTRTG